MRHLREASCSLVGIVVKRDLKLEELGCGVPSCTEVKLDHVLIMSFELARLSKAFAYVGSSKSAVGRVQLRNERLMQNSRTFSARFHCFLVITLEKEIHKYTRYPQKKHFAHQFHEACPDIGVENRPQLSKL